MWWADTTNDLLKQRNAADSAWINILTLSTGAPLGSLSSSLLSGALPAIDGSALLNLPGGGDVVDDTTPQLGGDLDVNGNSIVSASNADIEITPNGTGNVVIDGIKHPQADGTSGQLLQTDGAGQLSFADAAGGGFTLATPQATTSGSTKTFGSIPAGTTMIVVSLEDVSSSGSGWNLNLHLGDSGGIETSGYSTNVLQIKGSIDYSGKFVVGGGDNASEFKLHDADNSTSGDIVSGNIVLSLLDSANSIWSAQWNTCNSQINVAHLGSGHKSLSAELTQVRIVCTSPFDNGSINIMYQ